MDLASLIGLVGGFVMLIFGIVSSGGVAAIKNFIDVPSVIITIGGSLTSVLGSNKLPDFINGLKSITLSIKEPSVGNPTFPEKKDCLPWKKQLMIWKMSL